MAGVVLNVRPALAVTCNTASIQAIAPSSSTITSAAETALGTLPYCLIDASINTDPALGDVIHYELDLPDLAFWNSRLLFAGNSALAGVIPVHSSYLAEDYAVVGTDTGHTLDSVDTNNAAWALNNPPAVLDFEYDAVHQVAVAAKVITGVYYGKSIGSYNAYFDGCSTGGRQALVEAENYPADFNGIVAGDPAIGLAYLAFSWNEKAILTTPKSFIDDNAINLVNRAVLNQCDGLDGVVDGLIQDPSKCPFDPSSLQCPTGQTTGCLSSGQVAALKLIYEGPVNTTGASLYPGLSVSDPAASAALDAGWEKHIDGCPETGICVPPRLIPLSRGWAQSVRQPSGTHKTTFSSTSSSAMPVSIRGPSPSTTGPNSTYLQIRLRAWAVKG